MPLVILTFWRETAFVSSTGIRRVGTGGVKYLIFIKQETYRDVLGRARTFADKFKDMASTVAEEKASSSWPYCFKTVFQLLLQYFEAQLHCHNLADAKFVFFLSAKVRTRPSASWYETRQWQWHDGCHFVSFVMYICGTKFKEHCFNISRVILDWVLYRSSGTTHEAITFLICIIQKRKYL